MQLKTHLALGIFAAVFFLPHVNNRYIFVPVVLIASLLPDLDSGFTNYSKGGILSRLSFLSGHRGIFHSFTLCLAAAIIFALYWPALALPFFLGYGIHLLADSWTVEGIKPFWPYQFVLKGRVRDGGVIEGAVFMVFGILSIIFFILLFV